MSDAVEAWRKTLTDKGKSVLSADDLISAICDIETPTLAGISAKEQPKRPWFFDSIIPAGAFLITGRSKVGKSWFLMQLVLCAARGQSFLGFESLGKVDCLYVASEDDEARIKSRVAAFGVDEFPSNVHIITRERLQALAKDYGKHLTLAEFLRVYLRARPHIKIVILDTESTIRAAWGNETKSIEHQKSITRKDYAEVSEMDSIAIDLGIFIGLVNHTSKRKAMQWLDIHETINRTNTAMAGASGSFVLSDPPDKDPNDTESRTRVLGIRGRDITEEFLFMLEQGQGIPSFKNLGAYILVQQTMAEREILDTLKELDEEEKNQWHTARDIADALGKPSGAVQRAITRMMKKGPVTIEGRKVETRKKLGIRIVPTMDDWK